MSFKKSLQMSYSSRAKCCSCAWRLPLLGPLLLKKDWKMQSDYDKPWPRILYLFVTFAASVTFLCSFLSLWEKHSEWNLTLMINNKMNSFIGTGWRFTNLRNCVHSTVYHIKACNRPAGPSWFSSLVLVDYMHGTRKGWLSMSLSDLF